MTRCRNVFRWLMQMKVQQTITQVVSNSLWVKSFSIAIVIPRHNGESNKIFPSISSESKTNFQLNSKENLLFLQFEVIECWHKNSFFPFFFFLLLLTRKTFYAPRHQVDLLYNFRMNHWIIVWWAFCLSHPLTH